MKYNKEGIIRIEIGLKHYHRVLILHFKFQFSKSVKSSTFHIFLNLTYPLRKNLSFPKYLKITQKFTQNCQIVDNVISIGIWRRLKRDRDIGRKAVLSDVKTAFTFTPALRCLLTTASLFQLTSVFPDCLASKELVQS